MNNQKLSYVTKSIAILLIAVGSAGCMQASLYKGKSEEMAVATPEATVDQCLAQLGIENEQCRTILIEGLSGVEPQKWESILTGITHLCTIPGHESRESYSLVKKLALVSSLHWESFLKHIAPIYDEVFIVGGGFMEMLLRRSLIETMA